jgi:predicted dienelactone hydrolase
MLLVCHRFARGLVLLLVTLGCSGCLALVGPAMPPPEELGTHPVGVTTIGVKDPIGDRYLTAEVWYPAASPSSEQPEIYRVEAMERTVAKLRSAAGAHRDVEPWRDGGRRPVVLMSHGRGSTRFGNVSLAELLASHGYLVAAPDHPGNTIDDQLKGIGAEERATSALERPRDLSRLLDALVVRSNKPLAFLSGMVDVDRVAVVGHSMGGLAALGLVGAAFDTPRQREECLADDVSDWRCEAAEVFGANRYRYKDPRIKAALLIAPAGFDLYREDGIAEADVPTLVVGALLDERTPYATFSKPTYEALRGPRYLLDLERAGHLTATDICDMIDSIGPVAKAFGGRESQDGCAVPGFTSRDALRSVARASLPFLSLYLDGDPSAEPRLELALDSMRTARAVAPAGAATFVR